MMTAAAAKKSSQKRRKRKPQAPKQAKSSASTPDAGTESAGQWSIVVESIGTAGAGMVKALRSVVPIPETHLAQVLFQAPSLLVAGLTQDVAERVNELLLETGLKTRAAAPGETIENGDADHEIALVVRDVSRVSELLAEIVNLVGYTPDQARSLLCTSPTILVGKVSANTVAACRERFEKLGAEIDVTRPKDAIYDVFLGQCSPAERARVQTGLGQLGIELPEGSDEDTNQVVVHMGLSHDQAEKVWEQYARSHLPLRLISRDFERFDVTLDAAEDTPKMMEYLVSSTGMPENVAHKIVRRTPIVLHQLVDFEKMTECIAAVNQLGGRATGHLVVFQSFDLRVARLGDEAESAAVVRLIAGYSEDEASTALKEGVITGPLTHVQARWLQHELKQVGTDTERVLR